MQVIKRTIDIKAPVERVFDFLTTPTSLPSVWPSLIEVTRAERSADGAHSFDWTYKMAGLRFHGRSTSVTVHPLSYVEQKVEGEIPGTFRWTYDRLAQSATRVTVELEYVIPASVLGKLAVAVVARMNEHEMEALLANLKTTMEAATPPEVASLHAH